MLTAMLVSLVLSAPPTEWSCYPEAFGDGFSCDCGCGYPDPDCGEANDRARCTNNLCPAASVPLVSAAHVCAPNTCGDGFVAKGEVCDDGDGEGCDETCQVVTPGYRCSGFGGGCGVPVCGDRVVDLDRGERCDDGNEEAGDGCDACQAEPGFVCWRFGGCAPTTCGDFNIEFDWETQTGENCEDGNVDPGDGCDESCRGEKGWACNWEGCQRVECGDGIVARGDFGSGEQCDGGNADPGDGCDASCMIEPGWFCDDFMGCFKPECGDSMINGAENCDDGNAEAGDGCSELCLSEPGYACQYRPGPCMKVVCGDGQQMGDDMGTIYEDCDDGDLEVGDGCDDQCRREPGFVCDLSGCRPIVCGDGYVDGFGGFPGGPKKAIIIPPDPGGEEAPPEQCDDRNTEIGDGCDDRCRLEEGWVCELPGEPCVKPVCGDGVVSGPETCDDGDAEAGDGCSDVCLREPGYVCREAGQACETMPSAWVCSVFLYGTGDGCDCGCGTADPDCAGRDVWGCDFNHCLEGAPYPTEANPAVCGSEAPPPVEPGPEVVEVVEVVEVADEGPSEDVGADVVEAEPTPTDVTSGKTDEGCAGGGASALWLLGALGVLARGLRLRAR